MPRIRAPGIQRVEHTHVAAARRASASTTWEPMNPAPPVTRTFTDDARGSRTVKRQPGPSLRTRDVAVVGLDQAAGDRQAEARRRRRPGVRAASPRKATSKTRSRSCSGMPPQPSRTDTCGGVAAVVDAGLDDDRAAAAACGGWRCRAGCAAPGPSPGVDTSTTGAGWSDVAPRGRRPWRRRRPAAPAIASDTRSSSGTALELEATATPAWMRDSSNRSSTSPASRSASWRMVRW